MKSQSVQSVEFPFPFEPYPIQKDFMAALYDCFESSSLGVFESPTGTGKSLSLICGSLKWLADFEARRKSELGAEAERLEAAVAEREKRSSGGGEGGGGDWLQAGYETMRLKEDLAKVRRSLRAAGELERRVEALRNGHVKSRLKRDYGSLLAGLKKSSTVALRQETDRGEVEEDGLEAEESLAAPRQFEDEEEEEEDEEKPYKETQIVFATRTHSQLAQFLGELRRSPFGREVRVVTLASRANLCVNPDVLKLGNPSFINERCLEMKESGSKSTKKTEDGTVAKKQRNSKRENAGPCPFLRQDAVESLADLSLSEVFDIEDLKAVGSEMKACPYYAARRAVKFAQLVAVPYNILLHSKTRDTCGIDLAGSVVVVDEAHNLADTVASIHSARVTGAQLCHALSQLSQYHDKYRAKFAPANKMRINQIIFLLSKLIRMLGGQPGKSKPEDPTGSKDDGKDGGGGEEARILHFTDFIFEAKLDTLNFYQLLDFCRALRLPQKLYGFQPVYGQQPKKPNTQAEKPAASDKLKQFLQSYNKPQPKKPVEEEGGKDAKEGGGGGGAQKTTEPSSRASPLLTVLEFVDALSSTDVGGKVIIKKGPSLGTSSLQYLLLDPGVHFAPVVRAARSVVVAGGTMKPTDEFRDDLFSSDGATVSRVREFSCGHVVPSENVLCLAVAKGASGRGLDFTFQKRAECIEELGATLCSAVNVVPGGFVVFFPSYGFEAEVHRSFEKTGVLRRLEAKKKLFREPKSSSEVDKVLSAYAAAVRATPSNGGGGGGGGALLFAVVGGKMSEGINFGDDLGRCVAVVGLPYPNAGSPELAEKMAHLDARRGAGAGRRHYENLCLKALNQSIGRAIRHRADYAAILLLDSRYSRAEIRNGLPGWIRSSYAAHSEFRPAFAALRDFFVSKKSS